MAQVTVDKVGKQIPNSTFFPRYLAASDFGMASGATYASVSCLTGQFTPVGAYQVGYRNWVAFGQGIVTNTGRDDRQTATIKLYTATGQLTSGTLRLAVTDSNKLSIHPVMDSLLSNWSNGVKVAEDNNVASFESSLLITVNPGSTTTIANTNASMQANIPVSQYSQ